MISLKTPILLLIFNRQDTTQQVFDAIRKAKPQQLFVAADGPRTDRKGEREKCEETRKIIEQVDWDCEVKTLFREENLGCGKAVSSAITWFFENVEEGIILEDDCLPTDSFFEFCQVMLEKYKDKSEVMIISGTNFLFDKYNNNSYYFSNMPFIWGWATWKRTWEKYPKMNVLPNAKISSYVIKNRYKRRRISNWYEAMIRDAFSGKIDTWDAQLAYIICKNEGLTIIPLRNQISNIGYLGTHPTKNKKDYFTGLAISDFDIKNLNHPPLPPVTNWQLDDLTGKILEKYALGGFYGMLISFIPKFLKKEIKKLL